MKRRQGNPPDPVTIIDVAHKAGVSYATVSRVINNEDYVKPATRERVMLAINDLGYVANRQARSLRGGRTNTIGLLVRDLGTGYIGEIARGIDAELANREYDLMLYTTHGRELKESTYVQTLARGMVDGLLLVLPRNPENYLKSLEQRHFPHVLIDPQSVEETGPSVSATNYQGAYAATKYLIELGHRRIGLISGPLTMRCVHERLEGYRAALLDHQIGLNPAWISEGDFFQPSGFAGAHQLLTLAVPPTAILAANDVMALGVMEAVRDQGLRIPEDISIIGFDDIPQAASVHPALTTVRQPLEEMGRVAVQLLFEYIENPELPACYKVLPTRLCIRGSCQPPSAP